MEKKTALITGSYGGLGTCFVNIHAGNGGDLILVGRSQKKLDEQAEAVKKQYGVEAHTIAADLSTPEAAQMIYDTCKENGWTVDYLINNAGFGGQGDFARERTMEQDMSMIAVNIETPTRLCKLFLPDFINRGSGKVLNVSSTAATIPSTCRIYIHEPGQYRTSSWLADSSIHACLLCSSCSSGRDFARRVYFLPPTSGFLQIPPRDGHPCLRLTLPTAKRVADFHRQVVAHAGRTTLRKRRTGVCVVFM